ncbi:dipeptidyl peptidase 2-like [Acanthaster planci]|uniref:Dipeptidyl peptidase 2-like n=1 Tax=Acanthaster planci TaxID=133434 RepID=A0A8B7ZXP7_ACAPL|nr:dipeptidyl peptidase 2-like [Acanthaster planci]
MTSTSATVIFLPCVMLVCLSITGGSHHIKTEYFDQIIDHFNFASHGNRTFRQRYMLADDNWSIGTGPIFLYTGNEAPVTIFVDNTGFLFDIAPEFKAVVVFAEHRFYGESLPFGSMSFNRENLGLLTVEQALADYASLILHLKEELHCHDCKVIAFGGSYGGMLSAYMRLKYPNIVDGAVASSAPIYSSAGLGSETFFFDDVTKAFGSVPSAPDCVGTVRRGFTRMEELAGQGKVGLSEISATFKLCKPLINKDRLPHLQGWIREAFASMAMANYPYNTSFLGDLPPWPVNVSCQVMVASKQPLQGLAESAILYYNGTRGSLECMDIDSQYVECADPTGCGSGDTAKARDWQVCTEVTMPAGTNGVTDMFPYLPFTSKMKEDYCLTKWNIAPRPNWLNVIMWGKDIKTASNIVFSNGALDPWRGGGVLDNPNPGALDTVLIYEGAHHLDLRGANAADPVYVIRARQLHRRKIREWVE